MTRTLLLLAALLIAIHPSGARAQNTPPVANPDNASIAVGKLLRLDVLANDTDADDDTLQIIALTKLPRKGEAAIVDTLATSQRILYRSNANAAGLDSLRYRIADGHGGEAEAAVRITLLRNDPPVARNDAATVIATAVVEVDVLANDTDPDGDTLRIAGLPLAPLHGTAAVIGVDDQRIRYDPDDDFTGIDSLRYQIIDEGGNTATARVRLTVNANRRPVARNDAATIFINETTVIDVLANDTDAEGDPLSIFSLPGPLTGTAEIIEGGTRLRYTPPPGFLGTQRFDYTLSDGVVRGGSLVGDRATVTVRVLPPTNSFLAVLSGAGLSPPVQTPATGQFTATLDGNALTISGSFSELRYPLRNNGAVLSIGPAGRNGTPALALTASLLEDRRGGTLAAAQNTFTLPPAQTDALFTRRLYVVLRTAGRPDGEIRGHLLPAGASAYYRAVFSGRAVVPATSSNALGAVVAERVDNTLTLTGAFDQLESDFFPAGGTVSLYQGEAGLNGAALFDLDVDLDADRRGGVFPAQTNQYTLTNQQVQRLDEGLTYLVIRSQNAQGGAIRGQLLPLTAQVFETTLAGGNEAPPVAGTGAGSALAFLDGPTLTVSGAFGGLSSKVDLAVPGGAHLHEAAPGANGPILFELGSVLTPDRLSGLFPTGANTLTVTPENQAALVDGLFYVNIHTENHGGGALRGQLLPSPNRAPAAAEVTTPADGALVDLSVDPSTPLSVRWGAADDANDNTVYYGWQLAQDLGFQTLIYASDLTPEPLLTTATGMLDAALAGAGINPNATVLLYHRVVTTDGSLSTAGPPVQVTVIRGFATDVEKESVPEHFVVRGNYPNPFNPTTTVGLDLPQAARVRVEVFDVLGRRVLVTPAHDLAAGFNRAVTVDARALASGLYLYRVVARAASELFTATGRMTVLK